MRSAPHFHNHCSAALLKPQSTSWITFYEDFNESNETYDQITDEWFEELEGALRNSANRFKKSIDVQTHTMASAFHVPGRVKRQECMKNDIIAFAYPTKDATSFCTALLEYNPLCRVIIGTSREEIESMLTIASTQYVQTFDARAGSKNSKGKIQRLLMVDITNINQLSNVSDYVVGYPDVDSIN